MLVIGLVLVRNVYRKILRWLFLGCFIFNCRWDEDVISVRQGSKYPKGNSNVWIKKFICIEG